MLQRLRLSGCRTLTDGCMQLLLPALPQLRDLDVSGESPYQVEGRVSWVSGTRAG